MTDDAEFCEVFFEDVRVPATNLLGAPGAGWGIAMGIVQHERGPMWTFVFQRKIRRSLTQLLALARSHPATRDQLTDLATRQRLAQAHIEVEILRLAGYRSLTNLLRTGHPGNESSLEKVLGSETDQRLQDLAMSLFGPYGALRDGHLALGDGGIPRQFLYARSETIMGGTSEIQRNVIAQRILGLPR
jgi:alkylation response protein AidB-like acyl-CoA dehydrogenase